jgi:hypothetical protein
MREDGAIFLQLRAETPDGQVVGDAAFLYEPTHSEYHSLLEHLGGLQPGESKVVPCWPDGDEEPAGTPPGA